MDRNGVSVWLKTVVILAKATRKLEGCVCVIRQWEISFIF